MMAMRIGEMGFVVFPWMRQKQQQRLRARDKEAEGHRPPQRMSNAPSHLCTRGMSEEEQLVA
jgi:hypothetical protein